MTVQGEGPWVLHFHTSRGYGETYMRFRTRKEARDCRDDMRYGRGLVFYPIYRDENGRR